MLTFKSAATLGLALAFGLAVTAPTVASEALDGLFGGPALVSTVDAAAPLYAAYQAPAAVLSGDAAPAADRALDMSGADGSLRACYANGGMAKQSQNLEYYCNYQATASSGSFGPATLPLDAQTGYEGVADSSDPALVDCISRGGSLTQLANNKFACAM